MVSNSCAWERQAGAPVRKLSRHYDADRMLDVRSPIIKRRGREFMRRGQTLNYSQKHLHANTKSLVNIIWLLESLSTQEGTSQSYGRDQQNAVGDNKNGGHTRTQRKRAKRLRLGRKFHKFWPQPPQYACTVSRNRTPHACVNTRSGGA